MAGAIEAPIKLVQQPVANIPIAIATTPLAAAMGLIHPTFLQIQHQAAECLTWVIPYSHLEEAPPLRSADIGDSREILLYANPALRAILRLRNGDEIVRLSNLNISQWSVLSALIEDLPDAAEAHLPKAREKEYGRSKWLLLSSRDCSMPVRVQWKDQKADVIRLSLASRVLLNPAESETRLRTVQLQPLPRSGYRVFPRSVFYRWRRTAPDFRGILEGVKCAPSVLCERLVGWIIGGNTLYLRTIEADPGDDTYYLVRISRGTFDFLGIAPGDQVELSWADRRTFAIALELQETAIKGDLSRGERVHTRIDRGDADNLTIAVAAKIRAALGIPRRTAVKVRRRTFPLFLRQINQLTIPALGLYLAALTISGISITLLLVGLFCIVVLLLLSLRNPQPPKGLW